MSQIHLRGIPPASEGKITFPCIVHAGGEVCEEVVNEEMLRMVAQDALRGGHGTVWVETHDFQ